MFTGIIESIGEVKEITNSGSNKTFWIESIISSAFKVDESISHNGVCLTIEEINGNLHRVTAIAETLKKTNLNNWHPGSKINLERSILPFDRLDGHFVQGHIDTTAVCKSITDKKGSFDYVFQFPKKFAELIIEKGSICVDGVSLTAYNAKKRTFAVSIIPYTYNNTNLRYLKENETVNIEFDLIGKYVLRKLKMKKNN